MRVEQIFKWHDEYCDRLERFTAIYGNGVRLGRPTACIYLRGTRAAGKYFARARKKSKFRTHECVYMLPYMLLHPDHAEQIVAHECCHAYQFQVNRDSEWHGDLFKFLLSNICNKPALTYHQMNVAKARALGEILMSSLPHSRGIHKRYSTPLSSAACESKES